jgi:hypothetical protein
MYGICRAKLTYRRHCTEGQGYSKSFVCQKAAGKKQTKTVSIATMVSFADGFEAL